MATELRAGVHCSFTGSASVSSCSLVSLSATSNCSFAGSVEAYCTPPIALSAVANGSFGGGCGVTSLAPITTYSLSAQAHCSFAGSVNIYSRGGVALLHTAFASFMGSVGVEIVPPQPLTATAHCSFYGAAYLPPKFVVLAGGANASFGGTVELDTLDPDDPFVEGGYNHWLPQPAIDPWNWLACKTGFGSTMEGLPHLNLTDGTETDPSPLKLDVQRGIRGTHFMQWNWAWLAEQEDPPSYDPTYAAKIQRLAAVLGMQEQISDTVLDTAAINDAMVDADGNSLGWLYFWDLQRTVGDDDDGLAALHVGSVAGLGLNMATVPQTVNCYWSCQGRGQGLNWDGTDAVRGNGACSDSGTGIFTFWRRPVDDDGEPTGPWEAVGTFSPDAAGRWRTPPAAEDGYIYSTSMAGSTPSNTTVTFSARQYATNDHTYFTVGREIYVVEHHTSMIYVLECDGETGLQHIFSSDAAQWYRDGKAKSPYALPKSDVLPANVTGSPAGYVDGNGRLHVFYLKDADLKHIVSVDWGGSFTEEATVISGQDLSKAVEFNHEGRQYCYGVNTSGDLYCYISTKHFADTAWTLNTNKFLIISGADTTTQPGHYVAHGILYAYTFVGEDRKCYSSKNFGKTWTAVT